MTTRTIFTCCVAVLVATLAGCSHDANAKPPTDQSTATRPDNPQLKPRVVFNYALAVKLENELLDLRAREGRNHIANIRPSLNGGTGTVAGNNEANRRFRARAAQIEKKLDAMPWAAADAYSRTELAAMRKQANDHDSALLKRGFSLAMSGNMAGHAGIRAARKRWTKRIKALDTHLKSPNPRVHR